MSDPIRIALAVALVILCMAGLFYVVSRTPVCDTTLRVDETGIQLSDPCGQVDGLFR